MGKRVEANNSTIERDGPLGTLELIFHHREGMTARKAADFELEGSGMTAIRNREDAVSNLSV